ADRSGQLLRRSETLRAAAQLTRSRHDANPARHLSARKSGAGGAGHSTRLRICLYRSALENQRRHRLSRRADRYSLTRRSPAFKVRRGDHLAAVAWTLPRRRRLRCKILWRRPKGCARAIARAWTNPTRRLDLERPVRNRTRARASIDHRECQRSLRQRCEHDDKAEPNENRRCGPNAFVWSSGSVCHVERGLGPAIPLATRSTNGFAAVDYKRMARGYRPASQPRL